MIAPSSIIVQFPQSLTDALRDYEREIIRLALREARGSVTEASKLLLLHSHQALNYMIKTRHPELLKERTAVRPGQKPLMRPLTIKGRGYKQRGGSNAESI